MKLDPDLRREVHRISDRYVRLGKSTPVHEVKTNLGPKRRQLDSLIPEQVIQNFGASYLPRLRAVVEFEHEDIKRLCLRSTTIVLNALQELYKTHGENDYGEAEVTEIVNRMISHEVEPEMIRIGMYFATDFHSYVSSWNQGPDGGTLRMRVTEGILDFENIQSAWTAELGHRKQQTAARMSAHASSVTPDAPADFDHLTNVYNRARYDRDLPNLLEQAGSDFPLGLLMLDVDNFKQVNDTNEDHSVGDEVLNTVGARIRSVCVAKGFAYRYGGDEFAALLPNHSIEEAMAVAERIRLAVELTTFHTFPKQVTVSIGVATFPGSTEAGEELQRQSDKAMYAAKNAGGNRVRSAAARVLPAT